MGIKVEFHITIVDISPVIREKPTLILQNKSDSLV